MTSKVIEGLKSSSNFSVNPTLPNTFISESILIKIYIEYFRISMSSKVIEGHIISNNFSVNATLPNTFIYESILTKIYMNAN